MATVNYSVPAQVRKAFNTTFSHTNKSAVIATLMSEAVAQENLKLQRARAIDELLVLRKKTRPVKARQVRQARQRGRS